MALVFFGTGPVAAASLEAIAESFEIELVITKQSPSHHRGPIPVQTSARKLAMPIEFANSGEELNKLIRQKSLTSQAGIIVDFGVIVSSDVINSFPLGIINSHFSLLPEWRGADPISFTILSGQTETGVSLMKIVEELDEGPLLAQEKVAVPPHATTPELTQILIHKSNKMLARYIPEYLSGNLKLYSQPDLTVSYSRKLTKDDGILDWSKPAAQLEREIRAFIEWPKSRATLAGRDVIITKAHAARREEKGEVRSEKPGKIFISNKQLKVQTGNDMLVIERLKPAGKPEMSTEAFLAGYGKGL